LESFFETVLGAQPTGALGKKPDENKHYQGHESLESDRDPPSGVALVLDGSKDGPS